MENKYKSNMCGVCPVCGSRDLRWGDSDCNGDYIGYEYECGECHINGTEWYRLVFDGHEVEEYDAETDTYNWENVNDYLDVQE